MPEDLTYLRTYACRAAGCLDPAWAERGLHASNCMQDEVDYVLDEVDRLRHALTHIANRDVPVKAGWEGYRNAEVDAMAALARAALGGSDDGR